MKNLKIQFDKYYIDVSEDSVKKLVEDEFANLTSLLKVEPLPIIFAETESNTIALFRYLKSNNPKPLEFEVYLNNLDGLSAMKIKRTVRHEFAHYLRFLRYGPAEDPHDNKWEEICRELKGHDKPVLNNQMTEIF